MSQIIRTVLQFVALAAFACGIASSTGCAAEVSQYGAPAATMPDSCKPAPGTCGGASYECPVGAFDSTPLPSGCVSTGTGLDGFDYVQFCCKEE